MPSAPEFCKHRGDCNWIEERALQRHAGQSGGNRGSGPGWGKLRSARERDRRQLRPCYDLRHGARAGPWNALMVRIASNLERGDFAPLAAYIAFGVSTQ